MASGEPSWTLTGTHRFLSHDELLHLLHLRDVVLVGLELPLADPFVNADEGVSRDVLPVIHTWRADDTQIILQLHVGCQNDRRARRINQ